MNYSFKCQLLFLTYLFFFFTGFTQELSIKNKLEEVIVLNDTTFVRQVSVWFKETNKTNLYPIFYDIELEKLSDIKLYVKRGNRFKPLKDVILKDEKVQLDYITSKKIKLVSIPLGVEVKISYTIRCDELMYFSNLRFFSNDIIDSLTYHISIPNKFHLAYNTDYTDLLDFIDINSTSLDSITEWNIRVKPKKVAYDPLSQFGLYKNIKEPLFRCLVVPSSYKNKEKEYINNWYLEKVKPTGKLSPEAINKIDELTKGVLAPKEIINILYNYVRNNFKYVAIEIGMGAFIPSFASEVYINKHGDCKDLSNFLSAALNYKGVKSNLALAATLNHITDCDFPSLSSANHVVCLAYVNNKPIVLDPTDPIHLPETPVQSLQDRSILIVNSDGGEYYKVSSFTPQHNLIDYKIELDVNFLEAQIGGSFKVNYKGISGNFLKRALNEINDSIKKENFIKKYYEHVFGNQVISDFEIKNNNKTISVKGELSINEKIVQEGNDRFLFIDFLPELFENIDRETLLEGTSLGNPFSKKVSLRINLVEPHKILKPVEYWFSHQDIALLFKVSSSSEYILECNYEFMFNSVFINKQNLDKTNDILKSFKEIINEPVILEIKA